MSLVNKQYLESIVLESVTGYWNELDRECHEIVDLLIPAARKKCRTITVGGNQALFITKNLEYFTKFLEERNLTIKREDVEPMAGHPLPCVRNIISTFYHISF